MELSTKQIIVLILMIVLAVLVVVFVIGIYDPLKSESVPALINISNKTTS